MEKLSPIFSAKLYDDIFDIMKVCTFVFLSIFREFQIFIIFQEIKEAMEKVWQSIFHMSFSEFIEKLERKIASMQESFMSMMKTLEEFIQKYAGVTYEDIKALLKTLDEKLKHLAQFVRTGKKCGCKYT